MAHKVTAVENFYNKILLRFQDNYPYQLALITTDGEGGVKIVNFTSNLNFYSTPGKHCSSNHVNGILSKLNGRDLHFKQKYLKIVIMVSYNGR